MSLPMTYDWSMTNSIAPRLSPTFARIAAGITDPVERELWIAQVHAGDDYEAATDGAIHHAYPADVADAKYRAVKREYDRASRALIAYRQGR